MRKMTKQLFEELCEDSLAYLYVIRLSDEEESFYKVGVTSKENTYERISTYPYDVDLIMCFSYPYPRLIMDLESTLIRLGPSYKPLKEFGGYSECISDISEIEAFLNTLTWIRDLKEHEYLKPERETRASVENQIKQYRYAVELSPEFKEEALDNFLISNPDFAEWLDSGVTISNMLSLGKVRTKIDRLATELRKLDNASNIEIEEGFYSSQELKEKIQAYYDSINVDKKAKITDIPKLNDKLSYRRTSKMINGAKVDGIIIERN